MEEIVKLLIACSASSALTGFLLKDWLAVRLKNAIDQEYREQQRRSETRWELKRQACLDALGMADAVFSNLSWEVNGTPLENIVKQDVSTVKAREIMNRLILSCDSDQVGREFLRVTCVRAEGEADSELRGDAIHDIRIAVRRELGFGTDIELDRKRAFIPRLEGDKTP